MQTAYQLAHAILSLTRDLLLADDGAAVNTVRTPLTTPFSNASQTDWSEGVRLWNAHGRGMLAQLPSRACPACGGRERRPLFESYDGYPYVECAECSCWYVPLHVDAPLFDRFLEACPAARRVADRSFTSRQSQAGVEANLERVGRYLDLLLPLLPEENRKSYLDVGCGLGHSLVAAKARNLNALGIESSDPCIAIATRNGLDVRRISAELPATRFSLISFWESLEHMTDPAAVLSRCLEMLDERGILAFTVPNQNSPMVRVQRGDCSVVNGGCDTPGHINLFNPSSIGRLLERTGFTLLALDGQYGLSLPELLSYTAGNTRGAQDLLNGLPIDSGISDLANVVTRAIGPAISVLERVTLTTPILFGFACRKGSAATFSAAVESFHARRKAELVEEIESSTPVIPDRAAHLRRRLWESEQRIALLERERAEVPQ